MAGCCTPVCRAQPELDSRLPYPWASLPPGRNAAQGHWADHARACACTGSGGSPSPPAHPRTLRPAASTGRRACATCTRRRTRRSSLASASTRPWRTRRWPYTRSHCTRRSRREAGTGSRRQHAPVWEVESTAKHPAGEVSTERARLACCTTRCRLLMPAPQSAEQMPHAYLHRTRATYSTRVLAPR